LEGSLLNGKGGSKAYGQIDRMKKDQEAYTKLRINLGTQEGQQNESALKDAVSVAR